MWKTYKKQILSYQIEPGSYGQCKHTLNQLMMEEISKSSEPHSLQPKRGYIYGSIKTSMKTQLEDLVREI